MTSQIPLPASVAGRSQNNAEQSLVTVARRQAGGAADETYQISLQTLRRSPEHGEAVRLPGAWSPLQPAHGGRFLALAASGAAEQQTVVH